ncbi:MAG: hypothetical protein CYPHOPRED_001831 [Cyphobasidiales sp. Tagirdzhanova-0007]|nr:MAG: hypothetical protein CYPHOPRED_001831 [Cyphobasidiales sp. Tagirdzhanova-0007]
MEEVCILCNRAIEWPTEEGRQAYTTTEAGAVVGDSGNEAIQRIKSSNNVNKAGAARVRGAHVAHHGQTAKVRKNHSSSRLAARGKSNLKPLMITPYENSNSNSLNSAGDREIEGDSGDLYSPVPNWTSIYCSDECRKEDELRSRLAFANLNEESNKHHQSYSGTSPILRPAASSSYYVPSSFLAPESEGSEFDWTGGGSRYRSGLAGSPANMRGTRDSNEFTASRRYSDGSDSSRLSAGSRPLRNTSLTRGSTDSLASLVASDAHNENRPELTHRSSARSSGLRAMTPIHHIANDSPRDTSPPVRIASPNFEKPLVPSAMMMRSNSDFINGVTGNISSTLVPFSAFAKTFRPASLGKPGLRSTKSSATLAISSDDNIRATIASEYDGNDLYSQEAHSSSYRPAGMPRYHATMPAKHTHRPHPSSSSIPYLSCSPSSPGSGSLNSARSTASTAPSSHSPRGEIDEPHATDSRKIKQSDERLEHASLTSYGLFHQRTPSTPSLTSLSNSNVYGRSPPASRSTRLSSSYDTMTSGGTISKVIRAQQAARNSSGSLHMTPHSPRRSTFEVVYDTHLHPGHPTHTDSTPTQSLTNSRAPSFVASRLGGRSPVHEVVHLSAESPGRARAPSITRTDLERVSSDRSMAPSLPPVTGRRQPSYLRPTLPQRNSDGSDASGSSPPSPGLPTPGKDERSLYHRRQPSHPAINQLQNEEYALSNSRPLTANSRSKSKGSFSWDHLPSYVPQYTAMDLDKVRRNQSGTNIHSHPEDAGLKRPQPRHADGEETFKKPNPSAPKKRLFYFPDDM